jgi:hypothetical protein
MRYLLPLSRHLFNYCNLATKAQSVEAVTSPSSSSAAVVSSSDVTSFNNCDAEAVANIRELDRYLLYDVIAKELFTTSGEAPWGHFSDSKPNRYYGHYDDKFEKENYYLTLCMYLLERCCGGGDREIVGRQSIVDETPDDFILESIRQHIQTNPHQSLFRVLLEVVAAIPMSKQCLEPYQNSYHDRSSGGNDRITRSMISSALAMLRNCHVKVLTFLSQYVEDHLTQATIQSLRDTLQKVKIVINMSMSDRGISNYDNLKESLPDSAKELESNEPLTKKARKSNRK